MTPPPTADRDLDRAGITDPALRAAYLRCRRLNARHGRTYYLATRLLTPARRPAVHALYGFARLADDIVDDLATDARPAERDRVLRDLEQRLAHGLATGRSDHPVVAALSDTAARYRIDHRHFAAFMASMRMDLTVTDYADWTELHRYMYGSAAVIGLQVLPVLGTAAPQEEAAPHAAALGIAFQLTNFLRDVGEDLDRDRVYLPADRLAAYGADRALLQWCRDTGRTDRRVRAALRDLLHATRRAYRYAALGIPMLDPLSRPCVATALTLYGGILDRIEAADYAILNHRVTVSRTRRATTALTALARLTLTRTRTARNGAPSPP
ncbi:phytoene/squalene synthase family protein [Streptomyces sp. NPDC092296]|uniref:phytoene/squalene synthase family protein n=1 Tax=Streptomyces sp. NPDC092296 TaxID=3366012 RepID=UPI0037FC75F1